MFTVSQLYSRHCVKPSRVNMDGFLSHTHTHTFLLDHLYQVIIIEFKNPRTQRI